MQRENVRSTDAYANPRKRTNTDIHAVYGPSLSVAGLGYSSGCNFRSATSRSRWKKPHGFLTVGVLKMACGSLLSEEDLCRFRTKKCRRLTSGACEFGITRCQYSHNQYWSRRCPIYLSERSFIRYIHVLCPCVTIKPTGNYDGPLPCGKNRCKQLLNCLLNSAATGGADALPQERRQSQALPSTSSARKAGGGGGGAGGGCGKDKDSESCWCPHPGEEVIENTCIRGGECPFAHSIEEILYHPLFYKMVICGNYRKGVCDTYYCPYVHGLAEKRRPSEYKLPFTNGIDIPPLPFVTVVTRIEKKKDSVTPALEGSLASTASASEAASASPKTERTNRSATSGPGKYAMFFRDRLGGSGQEAAPTGRWRKSLGRSSSRKGGGTAKRDIHRKGSLPSHLLSTAQQSTAWNSSVRGESALPDSLEPVAEESANQSEDLLDASKKNHAGAFAKSHVDTSVRSFADAFATGHVDACAKLYGDVSGDSLACRKDTDDVLLAKDHTDDVLLTKDHTKATEAERQAPDSAPKTAAASASDLFPASLLPASSSVTLMGGEAVFSRSLLEGDLTADALAPFLSVHSLKPTTAEDVVAGLPHAQLMVAALELYDKNTTKIGSDESDARTITLKNYFRTRGPVQPGGDESDEHVLAAQQDAGSSGRLGDTQTALEVAGTSCAKSEYAKQTDTRGGNSENCQVGEIPREAAEVEDASPTACSASSSRWLPFFSPCILSPESSLKEHFTARVRAAGADVLERFYAGGRQGANNEASTRDFAADASPPFESSAMASPATSSRGVPLPPGIPVPATVFPAGVQPSGTPDAARVPQAVHGGRANISDLNQDKSLRTNVTFAPTSSAGMMHLADTSFFTNLQDMGAEDMRGSGARGGSGGVTEETYCHTQQQNCQDWYLETCLSDKDRYRSLCDAEIGHGEHSGNCNKYEKAQGSEAKKDLPHNALCGSVTTRLQQGDNREHDISAASCSAPKSTRGPREKGVGGDGNTEQNSEKREEEFLSDEGEENNRSSHLAYWTPAEASGNARLSKAKQDNDVHVMEKEEGMFAGDDCGCPFTESALQSVEATVRLLTRRGWKGSVKQLKRMQKAAKELWELIHCGHVPSQAEVTDTNSLDPFSKLLSFVGTVGGDCVSQGYTTALGTLLPGNIPPTD